MAASALPKRNLAPILVTHNADRLRMKRPLQILALAVCVPVFGGCAVTVPVKVATKTTKLGVKTATKGVKTTAKVAGAMVPDGEKEEAQE